MIVPSLDLVAWFFDIEMLSNIISSTAPLRHLCSTDIKHMALYLSKYNGRCKINSKSHYVFQVLEESLSLLHFFFLVISIYVFEKM